VADHRHKRDTDARRKPRAAFVAAAPLALLATVGVVTLGVAAAEPDTPDLLAKESPAATASASTATRDDALSRSASRLATAPVLKRVERLAEQRAAERAERAELRAEREATARAVANADEHLWTTTVLNLWSDATPQATQRGVIDTGKRVLVTGREAGGRVELVVAGESRWVTAGYLSEEKPVAEPAEPAAPAGLSMAPCPDSSVESGLTQDAISVYRAVCNAFPQITSYGGWDNHGEHTSGRALDIMTSDVELGNAIAAFLQEHASELNLYDILWRQQIWTPVRASEGWRSMPSRGSATADHYDHVHVATNG
jgi:hypothetical protein